jgi:hypothetical protein
VGTENNELQASATGLTGSPVTFKASGTVPAGQSIFTGVLSEISNVGFPPNPVAIPGASLSFFNLTRQSPAGSVQSKADGSFVSPPLPVGDQYRIDVSADNYKSITYQKPSPNAGAPSSLGRLGMVPFSDAQGSVGIDFQINLTDEPTDINNPVEVRVDVYSGYYVGETDEDLIRTTVTERNVQFNGTEDEIDNEIDMFVDPGDWGILTLRASAPGYATQTRTIVVDDPTDFITIDDFDLVPTQ